MSWAKTKNETKMFCNQRILGPKYIFNYKVLELTASGTKNFTLLKFLGPLNSRLQVFDVYDILSESIKGINFSHINPRDKFGKKISPNFSLGINNEKKIFMPI